MPKQKKRDYKYGQHGWTFGVEPLAAKALVAWLLDGTVPAEVEVYELEAHGCHFNLRTYIDYIRKRVDREQMLLLNWNVDLKQR
jgi:hypothetical protein